MPMVVKVPCNTVLPVKVSDPIASSPVVGSGQNGAVFYTWSSCLSVPNGYKLVAARNPDGTGTMLVDDGMTVTIGSTQRLFNFSEGLDLSAAFGSSLPTGTVISIKVEFKDIRGSLKGSEYPVHLVLVKVQP
jgi:hypothetical protein